MTTSKILMDLQDTCQQSKRGFSSYKVVRVLRGVKDRVTCTFVQGIKLKTFYRVNINSSPQQFWMCTLTGYLWVCQEAKESEKANPKQPQQHWGEFQSWGSFTSFHSWRPGLPQTGVESAATHLARVSQCFHSLLMGSSFQTNPIDREHTVTYINNLRQSRQSITYGTPVMHRNLQVWANKDSYLKKFFLPSTFWVRRRTLQINYMVQINGLFQSNDSVG